MSILFDFLLLAVIGAALVGAFRFLQAKMPDNRAYQWGVGVALTAAFLLFWINGAVGIIGSADNDANMMYAGVVAVGFVGAMFSRFHAQGMARALFAMALAQVIVAVIALGAGWGTSGPIWPRDVLILTGFFTALWVGSAWLFLIAARQRSA